MTLRKIEYDALRPSVQIAQHLAVALNIPEEEHLAFVRLARKEREVSPIPTPTPSPALEEIRQQDLSGRAIKGFELGERIGEGGYGAVYRAVQATVERDVAIKIILPKYADQPKFIRRFEAEAQLVARLEHPHIVPLYDYWREPGVAYLVMRLLPGGSLEATLKDGPLAFALSDRFPALITGDIGLGKSTALRAFVHSLDHNLHPLIYLANLRLNVATLYSQILLALQIQPAHSFTRLLPQLLDTLQNLARKNRFPLLVIDEAHLLPSVLFDQLRFLLNDDFDANSLLTLVLLGQPDLAAKD